MASTVFILGAGFSANAGLPLASEFTPALLETDQLRRNGPSQLQARYLRTFVERTFGEGQARSLGEWPDLEDVLTTLDLSANSGHHLGPDYSAAALRVVRRTILVRMIRMLDQRYKVARGLGDARWQALESLFSGYDPEACVTLSLNWDTVFERGMERTQSITAVDYACGARGARFIKEQLRPQDRSSGETSYRLIKPHGSVNWLYCDACREIFWVPPSQTERVARTLFSQRDWELVASGMSLSKPPKTLCPECPHCSGRALGTRFATFSYRKALDFPMHASSWRSAEAALKQAANWVFIGYSMPSADYEFKAMLKRVQLSEPLRPAITLITGGDGADQTVQRFEKFFGKVRRERRYLRRGLDSEAIDHLRELGALRAA